MALPLSLNTESIEGTPMGDIQLSEEKNCLKQYVSLELSKDISKSTADGDLQNEDLSPELLLEESSEQGYGDISLFGNKIKLIFGKEKRGSVYRKSIQKVMILAKQERLGLSSTMRELKPIDKEEEESGDDEYQMSTNENSMSSTIENSNDGTNLELTNLSGPFARNIQRQKPKKVLCLNKMGTGTKNIQFAGFKISMGNDSYNYTYPSNISCIKAII